MNDHLHNDDCDFAERCRPVPNTDMTYDRALSLQFIRNASKRQSQPHRACSSQSCVYRSKYYGETLLKYPLSTFNHLF